MKVIGNLTKDAIIRAAVSEGITVTQALGTDVTFNTGATQGFAAAFDSNTGKVVIAYTDGTDGQRGKARVGTVDPSNNSISLGSAVTWQDSEVTGDQMSCVFDSNANKVVIFYTDTNNPSTDDRTGTAIVGTVSGTSISFGTKAAFESGNTQFITATFDSTNNKAVVFYRDADNSNYGTAAVGTVSGTSISFGSPVVFNSANTPFLGCSFDSNAGKILVVYKDVGNSNYGNSIVGTVSGTSISFGSEVTFLSANGGHYATIFDSSANKHVVLYDNPNDNNYGYARVGTISGTSVSYGTAAKFETGQAEYMQGVFDSNAGKVAIIFKDGSNSNRPTFVSGTVSGTDISFDTPVVMKDVEGLYQRPGIAYDSTNKRVVPVYLDATGSDLGVTQVIRVGYTSATGGTIADGSAVIVNANGTVSAVSGSDTSVSSATVYESANTGEQWAAFDSSNNKVVINYRDVGNSSYGTAVVGTVSGSTISFGTPVVYESAATDYQQAVFDSNANKFVLVYSTSATGRAIVGTVSGTSISFGSSTTFDSGQGSYLAATFDNNSNKVVVGYAGTNNYVETKVGTVSGTSISFGSAVVAYSASFESLCATFDSNLNKVVFGWKRNATGRAVVGTVSGTSISYGSSVVYESSSPTILQGATFDTSNNKVVIAYRASTASDAGRAVVGTVSGTSISFGTPVDFTATNSEQLGITFDSSVNKVVIAYDDGDTNKGTAITGTVSGDSISFDSAIVYEDASVEKVTAVFDSNANKTVIAYKDAGNSNYGTAVVLTAGSTTLTSENFVGFMDGAALDGTNGEILSSCSIARNQTSLTAGQTYFVSSDGSLSLTAGSPSVTAGTAISSTELIVKG